MRVTGDVAKKRAALAQRIKEAKACKLMALFEIARRINKEDKNKILLENPEDVYNYIRADYMFLKTEMVSVIYVDKLCHIIGDKKYKSDNPVRVNFPIKEIVAEALNLKAFGLFLVHNHPSGDLKPSSNDLMATKNLKDVLDGLDISFFDHIIIGKDDYLSIFDKIRNM